MQNMRPAVFFLLSFVLLWFGIFVGSRIRKLRAEQFEAESKMITVIQGGLVTLLGLLIGFTFPVTLNFLLPLVIAGALVMTLDMDSPRYGFIKMSQSSMDRVVQQITGTALNH